MIGLMVYQKNKIQAWNDFAQKEMQGKKSISLNDAMSIFDKYNINVDKSRLNQIANQMIKFQIKYFG